MQLSDTERQRLTAILAQYDQHPEVQRMREFIQHGDVTTYQHCKNVVLVSFWLNRRFHLGADETSLAVGAFLHDFYLYDGGELAGWAALRRVDPRWCYRGVAEVSIYVGEKFRGRGLGSRLLTALCEESEKEGYWTLHSTVLQDNTASLGLHTKCGFRVVGRRERIARDCHGRWLDTYLMERRAKADEPAGYKRL